jgi:hypothetical protein
VAPLSSADSQAQSHRCLELRRYVGGELRIDLTAARSSSWARSEALLQFVPLEVQFVPLEVVETIAGSGRGRVNCLFSPSAFFSSSMGCFNVSMCRPRHCPSHFSRFPPAGSIEQGTTCDKGGRGPSRHHRCSWSARRSSASAINSRMSWPIMASEPSPATKTSSLTALTHSASVRASLHFFDRKAVIRPIFWVIATALKPWVTRRDGPSPQ